jgi:hypothetical protein
MISASVFRKAHSFERSAMSFNMIAAHRPPSRNQRFEERASG